MYMRFVQRLGLLAAFLTLAGCSEATTSPTPAQIDTNSSGVHLNEPDQDCTIISGSVNIDSPADLQQFASMGCLSIHGSLVVRNTANVQDLSELSGLRFVRDGVAIGENSGLQSLEGLQSLLYVGDTFVVEGNDQLKAINIPLLTYVDKNFHLFDNPVLETFNAPVLASVGAEFIIATSPLDQLEFPALAYVGDEFIIQHMEELRTARFPQLLRLSGLARIEVNNQLQTFAAPQLKSIESTLEFMLNDSLTDIQLGALDFIGGPLNFIDNDSLSTCEIQGLVDSVDIFDIGAQPFATRNGPGECELDFSETAECRIIEGDVVINSQDDLQPFAGEECLSIRGGLFIRETSNVSGLNELSGVRFVSEWVSIAQNEALQSLSALESLGFIGFGLVVEENPQLVGANLGDLEAIGTVLHIFDQPSLAGLNLPSLEVIGDQWVIGGADDLQNVNAPSLEWLGAQVNIENNDSLLQVNLDSLAHAIGSVRVRYNQQLQSLAAPRLTHIGQSLQIQRNLSLESISFPALEFVAQDVFIDYNPLIDNCEVYGQVGQIDFYDIGGVVRVFQQQPGQCANFMEGQAGRIGQQPDFDDFDNEK
jgi:hypothetical protein